MKTFKRLYFTFRKEMNSKTISVHMWPYPLHLLYIDCTHSTLQHTKAEYLIIIVKKQKKTRSSVNLSKLQALTHLS